MTPKRKKRNNKSPRLSRIYAVRNHANETTPERRQPMNYITKQAMQTLITELRSVAPRRPLTYGESIQVARRQAAKLRQWAKADEPAINLIGLLKQRAVPVSLVASYKLGEDSGLT